MFLPVELQRGTKAVQFDVCREAIDQNFNCGCDRYAILRLDSLLECTVLLKYLNYQCACSARSF